MTYDGTWRVTLFSMCDGGLASGTQAARLTLRMPYEEIGLMLACSFRERACAPQFRLHSFASPNEMKV